MTYYKSDEYKIPVRLPPLPLPQMNQKYTSWLTRAQSCSSRMQSLPHRYTQPTGHGSSLVEPLHKVPQQLMSSQQELAAHKSPEADPQDKNLKVHNLG